MVPGFQLVLDSGHDSPGQSSLENGERGWADPGICLAEPICQTDYRMKMISSHPPGSGEKGLCPLPMSIALRATWWSAIRVIFATDVFRSSVIAS
ncbi:hypothetical protein ACFQX6_66885 [Streptosporangium lutulentum]